MYRLCASLAISEAFRTFFQTKSNQFFAENGDWTEGKLIFLDQK